jgi:hypothetical protein
MASLSLKKKHYICQFFTGNLFAGTEMGDFIILAVNAGQVAVGKEYGARPPTANKA